MLVLNYQTLISSCKLKNSLILDLVLSFANGENNVSTKIFIFSRKAYFWKPLIVPLLQLTMVQLNFYLYHYQSKKKFC